VSLAMNEKRLIIWGLLFTILMLFSWGCQEKETPTPEPTFTATLLPTPTVYLTPTPTPFQPPRYPEGHTLTGDLVQIAWFYKPPANGDVSQVASLFDTFILTKKDEAVRDQLRDLGVTAPILQYVRFDAIMDPGDCESEPWGNQVAYKAGDFCRISEQHPDWFLLDQKGNRIKDDEGFVYMDPGSQGWRDFWLERVKTIQSELGWYGVFLDNVEASLEKHEDRELREYPHEAAFLDEIEAFLDFLREGYFGPTGRPLFANIISLEDEGIWFRYVDYLDGAMYEAWAVGWRDRYLSVRDWEEQLETAEKSQEMGKKVILISQGSQEDAARQQFSFASYLLISEGNASFRYSRSNNHQQIWWYDNYDIDLGRPLGPRYQKGELWKRDFSQGQVIVDPDSYQAKIELYGE